MMHLGPLLIAMSVRVAASAVYVALIFLANRWSGAADVAGLVYILAICYIASALGRIGTDQLISARASHFRKPLGIKAGSILYTQLAYMVATVPLAALVIHYGVALTGYAAPSVMPSLLLALTALSFALGQTVATTWQAMGHPTLTVLVFPLSSYLILLAMTLAGIGFSGPATALSFAVPALVGLIPLLRRFPFRPHLLSLRWLRESGHYFVMGINFYLAAWAPFTFMHTLLSAPDVVLVNLATRLAALQSLPSNAIAGYLMPVFAINTRDGNAAKTEKTMRDVILLTLVFQVVYLLLLWTLYVWAPDVAGLNTNGLIVLLFILAIGQFINGLTGPVGPALLMAGEQKLMALTSTIITLVTLFTGIAAAKWGGATGFCLNLAAALIVQNLIYATFLTRKTGIFPWRFAAAKTDHTLKER
jgi:O-antigen/teichoic acid export membrane protein